MGTMDDFKERAKRSVMGRRGCRSTTDVSARREILAFVIWHQDADYVRDELLIAEGEKPGIIASYIYQKFKREFEREESERRSYGLDLVDRNMGYRHKFDALGGKAADHLRPLRSNARARQLTPTPGLTFGFTPSVRKRTWRP